MMQEGNVLALAVACREALARFDGDRGGHIVNLSSLSGHRVPASGGFYAATKFAVRALADVVKEALTADGLTVEDIDHVIPHQANIRIVHNVLDKLEIPREKAHLNIDRYGNTSSASVPVTLDETLRSGVIHEGQTLVMMAIGAGMSWGGAVVRW